MAALEEIADPVERARALTQVLKSLPDQNKRLSLLRGKLVVELLAQPGASLASVGAELNIDRQTVRQIRDAYLKKLGEAGE
ncbi:helix-turn-helix domain-containing protein [Streptomyces sp. NPDC001406]|uniref:helix-turn-helix domain-containing protein n=1 Tax=Streptomyces sp. NPDC001406 TaxID=3364572 RepID=UPI0036985C5B